MAYCRKCGKEILDEAVVCIHCGCATVNMPNHQNNAQPITIVNNTSSSASATATTGRIHRHHSFLFDFIMIIITSGLWIIWMIFRPKYY